MYLLRIISTAMPPIIVDEVDLLSHNWNSKGVLSASPEAFQLNLFNRLKEVFKIFFEGSQLLQQLVLDGGLHLHQRVNPVDGVN